MRVLLVNPPFYRLLGSHYNANSLGIAYIAAILNENGHDAWLYNADYVDNNQYPSIKKIFSNFHDYLEYFKDEKHPIWNETVTTIEEFNPEWVGYTCNTANVSTIDIISRKLKRANPKIKQVVGGVHATIDPNILKSLPAIDYAVRREGEFALLYLLDGKQVQGVIKRTDGPSLQDTATIDINALPFPERDKFWKITPSQKTFIDVSYVSTIRGCPYQCTYCASPAHWKRNKTQYRTPESIVKELLHIKDKYWNKKEYDYSASGNTATKDNLIIKDNSIVYFVDDIFTIKKSRIMGILNTMIDQQINIPWKCESRADHLDRDITKAMATAGCKRVKVGFETGSDRLLKIIKKQETKAKMREGARLLKEANIPFTAYFMTGFPTETDEDLKETIAFAKEIDADFYSLSILAPYFGTKIYLDLKMDLDKKPWEFFYHQTGELMVNQHIKQETLQEFLSLVELNNRYG